MPRQPTPTLGLAALALVSLTCLVNSSAAAAAAVTPKALAKADPVAGHEADAAAPGHTAPAEVDIFETQPSLILWTVVVFLGLLFILRTFAWKPLIDALHQREEHLRQVLLDAENARDESEKVLAEHRRRLAAADDQVRAMIDEAKKTAQARGDEIVKKAEADADALKTRSHVEIASARDQALNEIWSKTADLAVSVAGKVLGKSVGADDHRRLIEMAIGELPSNPVSHSAGGQPA